jgi:hypothetical protein
MPNTTMDEIEEIVIKIMNKYLDSKGYTGERVFGTLDQLHSNQIDVGMLKPYGMFIISLDDGSVQDNYGTFD